DLPRRERGEQGRRLAARTSCGNGRDRRTAGGCGMMLLTPDLHAALRANAAAHHDALQFGTAEPDPVPLVKFFNPVGAATWLATELHADGDTLFGLADLGFGFPELGSFSLSELAGVRLPFGLGIERDVGFASSHSLS